jgi:hypothetical protein
MTHRPASSLTTHTSSHPPAQAMRTASSTPPALSCSSTYSGTRLPGWLQGLGFTQLRHVKRQGVANAAGERFSYQRFKGAPGAQASSPGSAAKHGLAGCMQQRSARAASRMPSPPAPSVHIEMRAGGGGPTHRMKCGWHCPRMPISPPSCLRKRAPTLDSMNAERRPCSQLKGTGRERRSMVHSVQGRRVRSTHGVQCN